MVTAELVRAQTGGCIGTAYSNSTRLATTADLLLWYTDHCIEYTNKIKRGFECVCTHSIMSGLGLRHKDFPDTGFSNQGFGDSTMYVIVMYTSSYLEIRGKVDGTQAYFYWVGYCATWVSIVTCEPNSITT